jgi:hypothetical protein
VLRECATDADARGNGTRGEMALSIGAVAGVVNNPQPFGAARVAAV